MDGFRLIGEPSPDSSILAYGVATWRPRRPALMALAGLLVGIILCLVWWLILSRPVSIPRTTALLIAVTPRAISTQGWNKITGNLPALWREALRGSSRYPVVLGAYRTVDGWRHFVLVPRWRKGELKSWSVDAHDKWGITVLSDARLPAESRTQSYTQAWLSWKPKLGADLAMWADPKYFFALADAATSSQSYFQPFTGYWRDGALVTSLSLSKDEQLPAITDNDLSLNLPANSDLDPLAQAVLSELRLAGLPLPRQMPKPAQINVNLADNYHNSLSLSFENALTLEQKQEFMANLGLTHNRVIQLADGSLGNEITVLPISSSTASFNNEQFGHIEIADKSISIGDIATSTAPLGCLLKTGLARIDQKATILLQKSMGLVWPDPLSLTFGQRAGRLVICFEPK